MLEYEIVYPCMRIKKIVLEKTVQEKILLKHGVRREEIERGLLEGKPIFFRAKDGKYMAISGYNRYLTIIFGYERKNATIVTAYESSAWQKRLYKK